MIGNHEFAPSVAAKVARSILAVWNDGDATLLRREVDAGGHLLREMPVSGTRETEARELVLAVLDELEQTLVSASTCSFPNPSLKAACYSLLAQAGHLAPLAPTVG